MNIRDDAQLIIKEAIDRAMPDNAVKAALGSVSLPNKVRLVAIGKAGYQVWPLRRQLFGGYRHI